MGDVLLRLGPLQGDAGDALVPVGLRIAAGGLHIGQELVPDAGVDDAGTDAVDIDVVRSGILGDGLGHAGDGELGGGVGDVGGIALLAGHGGHVDDLAGLVGQHRPQHRLIDQEGALGVDIHHEVIDLLRHLQEVHLGAGPGDMVQDIDAAEGCHGGFYHGLHLGLVGDVALAEGRLDAVGRGDVSGGLGRGGLVHIRHHHIGPRLCQQQGGGAAHAAGAAGDHCVLALQRDLNTHGKQLL